MEDKIKFYEIANILDLDLEYDGDETDLRLHGRKKLNWGAETPSEYEEATNAIDAISYKGNGWEVYATYDVSGFHYWMLQQEEPNYINMTIMFDNDTIDATEIPAIKNAMDMAYSDAYSISEKYDYVPNSEYKRGGKVDGRSTRAKSTWNRGGAWTRDRNAHNKSENWEKPMNKRKYAEGGGVDEDGRMYSDYYETHIDEQDFEEAKEFYFNWMRKNNQEPEIENDIQFADISVVELDHILYHAEIQGYKIPLEDENEEVTFGETLTGLAWYMTFDSAGSDYDDIYNNTQSQEEFDNYVEEGKILAVYPFVIEVENQFQIIRKIAEYVGNEDEGTTILGYRLDEDKNGGYSDNLPYNDNDEYKRGGKVDGRSTRAKDTWNSGASWTRDRNAYNKSENWEKPLNQRGKTVSKSVTKSSSSASSKSSSSASSKGKSKKYMYIPNYMIRGAEVNNSGKTTDIDGANILDGIYVKAGTKYAEGGGLDLFVTPKGRNVEYKGKSGGIYKYKWVDMPSEYSKVISGNGQFKNKINPIVADEMIDSMITNYNKFKDEKYAEGGGVGNGYMVFNYTDNLYASNDIFATKKEANNFISQFRKRFEQQGYYRDSNMNKIDIDDIDLLVIDESFNPLRKYAEGGGVPDLDKKMALVNLDMIHEYSVKLDNMVTEETELEEWVKMKLTRIEQNIADVKHAVSGGEKFDGGGMIFKKQLLHISKYAKELIDMVQAGSNLMAWQENKLAIAADNIDGIYHYMDYLNHKNMDKFNEYLMRGDDEYKRGGKVPRNVGRDWIFKSKQKWEQDYDRKREYKEYKKEGWLANWFKDGGEVRMYEILDEVEDYSEVNKNDIPKILAQESFEKGLDDDEIQTKINKHLIKLGYNYDSNEYKWKNANYAKGGVPRNVGRDWIFKSKQKWEQDYDRKREYKEYKKEGWLANWFKDGGGVGETKENWNNASYDEKLEWLKTRTELYPEKGDIFDTADVYARTQYHLLPNNVHIAITQSQKFAKGGRVKNYKYVPNYMIESVDVERNGKTTEIDGGNILDGLYVKGKVTFEEGGYVENIPTETLEAMIGRKLNGWNDDKVIFNGIVYKKCFMKPYYKIA